MQTNDERILHFGKFDERHEESLMFRPKSDYQEFLCGCLVNFWCRAAIDVYPEL